MTSRQDLNVQQGATFSKVHIARDSAGAARNLTGYSARMAVRENLGRGLGNDVFLTTGADARGGTITLGGASGTITIEMTAEQTTQIFGYVGIAPRSAEPFVYFIYDLELVASDGVTVEREIEGRFILQQEVTE